jgi:hypothetical protein
LKKFEILTKKITRENKFTNGHMLSPVGEKEEQEQEA